MVSNFFLTFFSATFLLGREFSEHEWATGKQSALRNVAIHSVVHEQVQRQKFEVFEKKGLASLLEVGEMHKDYSGNVSSLSLIGTQVSDAGLAHLTSLTSLKSLSLGGTQVSDAGLKCLKGLTKLEGLLLTDTEVTDAGLMYLKELTKLEELDLTGTEVTNAGVANLKKALPNCEISH